MERARRRFKIAMSARKIAKTCFCARSARKKLKNRIFSRAERAEANMPLALEQIFLFCDSFFAFRRKTIFKRCRFALFKRNALFASLPPQPGIFRVCRGTRICVFPLTYGIIGICVICCIFRKGPRCPIRRISPHWEMCRANATWGIGGKLWILKFSHTKRSGARSGSARA